MTFVPSPNAVRISLELQQGTRPMANVLHAVVDDSSDPGLLATVAQFAYDTYAATFLPLLSTAVVLQTSTCYSLQSVTAPVASYTPVAPETGDQSGEQLPLQSAAVLTLRTNARGRSGRGRLYLSGWSEGSSSSSSLTPAASAALQTAAGAFLAAWQASDFSLVVFSQYTGNAPRPVGLALPVTEIELRSAVFGSQRNRNRRESSS